MPRQQTNMQVQYCENFLIKTYIHGINQVFKKNMEMHFPGAKSNYVGEDKSGFLKEKETWSIATLALYHFYVCTTEKDIHKFASAFSVVSQDVYNTILLMLCVNQLNSKVKLFSMFI